MLKKIFESTIIMGMSSVLVMALDLVRVKVLAVVLGPGGIGTLSLLNNFHTVATTVIGLGLGTGIVKYVATYTKEKDIESVQAVLSNAFKLVFFLALITSLLSCLLSPFLTKWIFEDKKFNVFLIIYAVSFPLAV